MPKEKVRARRKRLQKKWWRRLRNKSSIEKRKNTKPRSKLSRPR